MRRTGFSMMEMLVVIAVIGVMALLAGPALMRLAPYQRLRGEAQGAAALMRQARLKAAASQKPTRATVDCSGLSASPPRPCQWRLETARFKLGVADGWIETPEARRGLHAKVAAALAPFPAAAQNFGFASVCSGDPKSPPKPTRAGAAWVVFMPGGQTFSCPRPFDLAFYDRELPGQRNGSAWRLSVNGDTGRTELAPLPAPKLNP